jgi:prophage tail gpP-like protein
VVAAHEDPVFSVRFPLLSRQYEGIKDYRIESSYTKSTDGFSFTLFDVEPERLLGLELHPVELLIDGNSQVLGRIDSTEVGGDGTAVRFSGRDYIADMVECHVDPTVTLKKDSTVGDAILMAAAPVGIDQVASDDEVGLRNIRTGISISGSRPGRDFIEAKLADFKANPGEGIYAFLSRVVARQGATIQPSDSRSKVVLSEPNYVQPTTFQLIRLRDDTASSSNNVIDSKASRNYGTFPTFVLGVGREGKSGKVKRPLKEELDLTFPPQTIDEVHRADLFHVGRRKPDEGPKPGTSLYRLFYRRDTDSRNEAQLIKSVARAFAERFKEILRYEATVRGHKDPVSGAIWAVDTMVDVRDTVCGVEAAMWIEEVTLEYAGQGPIARLSCVLPGAYVY